MRNFFRLFFLYYAIKCLSTSILSISAILSLSNTNIGLISILLLSVREMNVILPFMEYPEICIMRF